MMKENRMMRSICMMAVLLVIALFFVGLFHEYTACLFLAAVTVGLCVTVLKNKQLTVYCNVTGLTIAVITAFYGLSCFWAVDSGMAFIGFMKFLPLLPLCLLLMQGDTRDQLTGILPYAMAVMTAVSTLMSFVPQLKQYVLVADRLAGFLQYPNTFALLLLISQLLLLTRKKLTLVNGAVLLVLLFGILYSGSRTVFALAIAANIALGLLSKGKKAKLFTLGAVAAAVVAVVVFALVSESNVLDRFLRFSLEESTFAGRFLYFWDALPVILRHPFGLGYMGYYYIQQSIQTGVYSTAYVHNEFLQLMLDIGWVPAILLMIAMVRPIFSRKTDLGRRLILAVFFLHCCFDFDLQFIGVAFVLLLFLDLDAGKKVQLRPAAVCAAGVPVVLGAVYMAVALLLPRLGQAEAAKAMYPWNTQNNITVLSATQELEQGNALADEILAQNEYVTLAYSMKAHYAYSQGNFRQLIEYKNEIFRRFPFQYAEYEEYCYMLLNGIPLYRQAGDTASVEVCLEELRATKQKVESLGDRLSTLGQMIVDQPTTQLPAELAEYIEKVGG